MRWRMPEERLREKLNHIKWLADSGLVKIMRAEPHGPVPGDRAGVAASMGMNPKWLSPRL